MSDQLNRNKSLDYANKNTYISDNEQIQINDVVSAPYMKMPYATMDTQKNSSAQDKDILEKVEYKPGDLDLLIAENAKEAEVQKDGEIESQEVNRMQEDSYYSDRFDTKESLSELKKEFDTGKEYKRRNIFGRKKANSKKMQAVVDSVSMLVNFLYGGVIKKGMDKDVFDHAYQMINEQYREIVQNCDNYLSDAKKNKNNARYTMVRRMHDAALREMEYLEITAENTYYDVQKNKDLNEVEWTDVLRASRSVHYENGKDGVKLTQTGANSSSVTVIEADGKKQFFKEDEVLKDYSLKDVEEIVNQSVNDPQTNYSKEEKDIVLKITGSVIDSNVTDEKHKKRIIENLNEIADNQVLTEAAVGDLDAFKQKIYEDIEDTIYEYINDVRHKEDVSDIVDNIVSCLTRGVKEGDTAAEKVKNIKENIAFFKKALTPVSRVLFAESFMKKYAKLPVGAKISTNNVVTSRFAKILDINFIAESKSTLVNINGETKKGIVMGEAKGELTSRIPQMAKGYEQYEGKIPLLRSVIYREQATKNLLEKSQKEFNDHFEEVKDVFLEFNLLKPEEISTLTMEQADQIFADCTDNLTLQKDKKFRACSAKYNDMKKILAGAEHEYKYMESINFFMENELEEYKKLEGIGDDQKVTVEDVKKTYDKVKDHVTIYSGKAKKDLMILSIFDFIMGQVDRHAGNYNVEKKWDGNRWVIDTISCFDNDACCGLMTATEMNSGSSMNARRNTRLTDAHGNLNIPAFDLDFAQKILSIEPSFLEHEFMDLLSKEQIAAMVNRLDYIKGVLTEELAKVESNTNTIKFIKNEKEWEEFGTDPEDFAKLEGYNTLLIRTDKFNM